MALKKLLKDSSKAYVLHSPFESILQNIPLEEYICTKENFAHVLFLWRNDKTVVIGKHQNPWKECKLDMMEEDEITLCRRKSGGGAVYQDLGNSCFTFIAKPALLNYKVINNELILNTLSQFNIKAEASGRNDILVDKRKVSGSAYKEVQGKNPFSLHHGTMLFNVQLDRMMKYLNPHKKKLESKGVQSVTSRVLNLNEKFKNIDHQSFCEAKNGFDIETIRIKEDEVRQIPDFSKIQDEFQSWNWRYGETPKFTNNLETRFEWGILDIHLDVNDGIIEKSKVFSDMIYPDYIEQLEAHLVGEKYGIPGLQSLKQKLDKSFPQFIRYNEELIEWLKSDM